MTFHRGQGGNNALRDAERFVSAMKEVQEGKKTLKQAVDDYDVDVRTRGVQEVEVSTVQTHATHVSIPCLVASTLTNLRARTTRHTRKVP